MSIRNSRILLLSAGAIVLATALALSAWLMLTNRPPDVSAQELLEQARSKNTTAESYRYTLDGWQTAQVEGDPARYETTTEATFVFDEGFHVITRGGDSPNGYSETLLLSGKHYRRSSPDGEWKQTVDGGRFYSNPELKPSSDGAFNTIDGLIDQRVVATETLNGVQVIKVTGQHDLVEQANAIWNGPDNVDPGSRDSYNQMVAGREDFTGWIGVEDGMLHAQEVSGSYPAAGEMLAMTFWHRYEFSYFNEKLTLPAEPSVS